MSWCCGFVSLFLFLFAGNTDGQNLWKIPKSQASPTQRPWSQASPTQRPWSPPKWQKPTPAAEPPMRCLVEEHEKVPCGEESISANDCETINCCHDGQMCYYGKAVTVQCTKDGQFIVVVARDATLPRIDLDSVSLLGGHDGPCSPAGTTEAFGVYQFPVTACGTTVKEEDGVVVYENRMMSSFEVGIGPRGSITRDSHFELLFQCRYSATAVEALVMEVHGLPPPRSVAAPGHLRVELRLGNGIAQPCFEMGCVKVLDPYSSFYSEADYPVIKILQEPVYVDVHIMERSDPNIVLTLEHCWATSTSSPLSVPQWDLLINGCPYQDDRYLTTMVPVDGSSGLPYPNHHKRFSFNMFTFVDTDTLLPVARTVFIHCSTAVCYPTQSDSCQQGCSVHRRKVRALRDAAKNIISSGRIILRDLYLSTSTKV